MKGIYGEIVTLECYDISGNKWDAEHICHYNRFKPILRPLSDMTEDEFLELFKLCSLLDLSECSFEFGENEDRFINANINGRVLDCIQIVSGDCVTMMNNDGTFSPINPQSKCQLFFLSKHFDLFGLIESGLAIDKTKHLTLNL